MATVVRYFVEMCGRSFLVLMLLALGLRLPLHELRRSMQHPVIRRGLVIMLVAVPLLAIVAVSFLPVPPVATGVILLMAVSPGSPLLVLRVRKQKGNMALALTLSLVLSLCAIVLLPLSLALLRGFFPAELHASPLEVLRHVLPPIVVPVAVGFVFQAIHPALAERMAPAVVWLFKGTLLVVVVAIVARSLPSIVHVDPWTVVAMIIVALGAAILGQMAGENRPEDGSLLATAAVYGNPAIVLYVARTNYPDVDIAPTVVGYLILRLVVQIPYREWRSWRGVHTPALASGASRP